MADSEINFFDPGVQQSAPQRTILHFLGTLSAKYQKLTPQTYEEEQALGVLLIAGGVQILDADEPGVPLGPGMARSCFVRLTSSGVNWHEYLANDDSKDENKVRGLVLQFVMDAHRRNRAGQNQKATAPPPTTPAPATTHKAEMATVEIDEEPAPTNDTRDDEDVESQRTQSEPETHADPAGSPRPFIHKPWPGSDSWHNWGVGVDEEGIWHLFHFWRSGDSQAVYQWKHHRYARVDIAAGQMDAIARRFIEQQSLPVSGDDEIKRIKSIISRLRKVICAAVLDEGHEPKGNPIKSPTIDRPAYLAAIKFGKVVNQSRHIRFDCSY